jgi:hypothetical protein
MRLVEIELQNTLFFGCSLTKRQVDKKSRSQKSFYFRWLMSNFGVGLDDGDHHGRRGGVGDEHGHDGGRQHEPEHGHLRRRAHLGTMS